MRKDEEYITNKKRFFDDFSDPKEDEKSEEKETETGPKGGLIKNSLFLKLSILN